MSTNSECAFIEVEKGKWYYILEDYNAPKNSWDWMEYATCYGPFPDYEAANTHLSANHPNPGGCSISELPEGVEKQNLEDGSIMKKLIENAHTPKPRGHGGWCRY